MQRNEGFSESLNPPEIIVHAGNLPVMIVATRSQGVTHMPVGRQKSDTVLRIWHAIENASIEPEADRSAIPHYQRTPRQCVRSCPGLHSERSHRGSSIRMQSPSIMPSPEDKWRALLTGTDPGMPALRRRPAGGALVSAGRRDSSLLTRRSLIL